jgi:hypothetical protein
METIPLTGISVWLIAKIFVLAGLAIYLVFALVILRQIRLMIDTVKVDLERSIKFLSYMHLIFAILVFLTALAIL